MTLKFSYGFNLPSNVLNLKEKSASKEPNPFVIVSLIFISYFVNNKFCNKI